VLAALFSDTFFTGAAGSFFSGRFAFPFAFAFGAPTLARLYQDALGVVCARPQVSDASSHHAFEAVLHRAVTPLYVV